MNTEIFKELTILANELDRKGYNKYADKIDNLTKRSEEEWMVEDEEKDRLKRQAPINYDELLEQNPADKFTAMRDQANKKAREWLSSKHLEREQLKQLGEKALKMLNQEFPFTKEVLVIGFEKKLARLSDEQRRRFYDLKALVDIIFPNY